MLRRISEPLALSEASLLVLRPAMNAPVLNVEFLPVGPARAALVVFAEEYGGFGLALGIRSNEGGQVAVFRNREPMDDSIPIADVLEPAIAHAERMGFLFDEDMVAATPGEQGRAQAKALWGRLTGEIELPPPPTFAPVQAAKDPLLELDEPLLDEGEALELVLEEELVSPEIELELPLDQALPPEPVPAKSAPGAVAARSQPSAAAEVTAAPAAPAPRPLPPTVSKAATLSKFRGVEEGPTSAQPPSAGELTDGGSALGRIPLVRVRRGGESPRRIPYIARLLSSF